MDTWTFFHSGRLGMKLMILTSCEVKNGEAIAPLLHAQSWRGVCLIEQAEGQLYP
jgi:hypothetical protein